jgi:signal transduction histidine kinase
LKLPGFLGIKYSFLSSKVARRIFFLFVICALIPLSALAYFSLSQVTKELYLQAESRLHQSCKTSGMSILEHLSFLEDDLEMISSDIHKGKPGFLRSPAKKCDESLNERFKGLVLMTDKQQFTPIFGKIEILPSLGTDEMEHVRSGRTLFTTRPGKDKFAAIFMVKALGSDRTFRTLLFGEINPEYLWNEGSLSPLMELLVLDASHNVLFSSSTGYLPLQELKDAMQENPAVGRFTWTGSSDRYVAAYRTMFMRPQFHNNWILVQSESRDDIMTPIRTFKKIFTLLIILTFLVVLFLSLSQISRSLVPIEMLQEATHRIAANDFRNPVQIRTGDEFEELGLSFNRMSSSLENHLQTMAMLSRIGIALSAEINTKHLLELILSSAKNITNADACALYTLKDSQLQLSIMRLDSMGLGMDSADDVLIPLYGKDGDPNTGNVAVYSVLKDVTVNIPDIYAAEGFDISGNRDFDLKTGYKSKSSLSVPLKDHQNEIVGVLQLTNARNNISKEIIPFSEEDQRLLEILASQAAVALSKNQLITRLEEVNEHLLLEISERRRAEEEKDNLQAQLLHAQKMEAIGQLAGGVAHDFNNVLTAIIGYGNLLLMAIGRDDRLKNYVNHILTASERAAKLVGSLLAFSRKQITNLEPIDVNRIITEVQTLIARLVGEDVELKTLLTDRDLTVMADSNQIDQVLMNLATNARDAMPDGGSLTICTDLIAMDDGFIKLHGYGEAGQYAGITVSDTGTGIDEETKTRIFEPFFTTKDVGKGTGLGLAMVYGIIKQHKGYISVHSELGKSTTFIIYLPLIQSEVKEKKQEFHVMKEGTETILLVEDNAVVRGAVNAILTHAGYKVLEAVDGEDAIHKFMENKDDIHLLILDVIMPKKNGKEVYETIKKIKPVKIIFTSGYTADIIHRRGIVEEGSDLILKPYSPYALLEKIRSVLDKQK